MTEINKLNAINQAIDCLLPLIQQAYIINYQQKFGEFKKWNPLVQKEFENIPHGTYPHGFELEGVLQIENAFIPIQALTEIVPIGVYGKWNRHKVVALRGTTGGAEWIRNTKVKLKSLKDWGEEFVEVHYGFWEAFDSLLKLNPNLKTWLSRDEFPLLITGHSLGGALAQMLAFKFGDKETTSILTFGAPKVGNKTWRNTFNSKELSLIRFENKFDRIPELPPDLIQFQSTDYHYLPVGEVLELAQYDEIEEFKKNWKEHQFWRIHMPKAYLKASEKEKRRLEQTPSTTDKPK